MQDNTETKIKLDIKTPKNKVLDYNGQTILIRPYLSLAEQNVLIESYIETYFVKKESMIAGVKLDYMGAELKLVLAIVHYLTNIDVTLVDADVLDGSDLWREIKSKIKNYEDFYSKLNRTVSDMKEQILAETSVSALVSDLKDKAYSLLNKFSEFTPEDAEKMKLAGLELLKGIEKSPVAAVIGEASMPKPKKTRVKKETL
jgi:hypothetical protein